MRYVCINYGFVLAWLSYGEGRFWVQVIMFMAWNFNTVELTPKSKPGSSFCCVARRVGMSADLLIPLKT